MKRAIIAAILALASVYTGCSKIKKLADINVDIPYNTQVSVPQVQGDTAGISLPMGVSLSFPSIAVATNSQQYLKTYGTAANMVTFVYLKSLAIAIISPTNRNFDFLDRVDLYLSAQDLPEQLVASQNNIPKGASTLNLVTNTSVNLKDYFVKDTIYFRLDARINAIPPAGEELNISSVFHMTANPLN